uniref:Uncharacterized protein n=1 Tax=Molossus molossus TaxID=27622 RepID=A0A7J8BYC1_MOLMO|nr:hypothetical protein HJG59_010011 [Molossus molossus]
MRRWLSTLTTTRDPPRGAHTPHPQTGVPLPAQYTAPSAGRSSELRKHLQPQRFLCWQSVSRSPFHISTPLPSSRTSSHNSHPANKPTTTPPSTFARSSGKGRAKSLSGNDVICNVHGSGSRLLSPDPTPSPLLLFYPLSSLD